MTESALAGLRVLLAEDEYLIAFELQDALIAAGADVIGPSRPCERPSAA
jgi:hypothetical protein